MKAERAMTDAIEVDDFRDAMRRTVAGVSVVTTDGVAGRGGLTVSSLCSLSIEPPSIVFCVHRDSRTLRKIIGNGSFAANVLAADQGALAAAFADRSDDPGRGDRFLFGDWTELRTGSPTLADALCSFDCGVASLFDFGSHRIVVGEVVALASRPTAPLAYCDRTYRQLGAEPRLDPAPL